MFKAPVLQTWNLEPETWNSQLCCGCHLLRLLFRLLYGADHVERLFRHVVALAFEDLAEALDRVFDLDVFALQTRELLADGERLRKETLDLACTRNGELVVFRKFVEPKDRDDV